MTVHRVNIWCKFVGYELFVCIFTGLGLRIFEVNDPSLVIVVKDDVSPGQVFMAGSMLVQLNSRQSNLTSAIITFYDR